MLRVTRTLALTSPHMHGDDVKAAQKRLHGWGRSKFRSFHPGEVTGKFNEDTASASKEARFFLGFPLRHVHKEYNQKLDALITGRRPLPPLYRLRRRHRIRAARAPSAADIRVKALNIAKNQIGTKENPPGTNRVLYSQAYGIIGPWCAMFVTWCFIHAGSKTAFRMGSRFAFVPNVVSAARSRNFGLRTVTWSEVRPGDLVCYDWEGNGVADHIGIFEQRTTSTSFTAIEGNTALGNDSNGGEVMRRGRFLSQVQVFVRMEHV